MMIDIKKNKIRTRGENVYSNFRGLNVRKDGAECKSFSLFY